MMWLPKFLRKRIVLGEIDQRMRRARVPAKIRREIMSGWKTWAGGIGLIASGVGMIAQTIASDEFDMNKIYAGIALIGAGLSTIGVGHKIEKTANGK